MVGDQHVCTPTLALPGEACMADAGCTSGLCYQGACSATCIEANDCGAGLRFGAQHSQTAESWMLSAPGLKVTDRAFGTGWRMPIAKRLTR